jgi:hypothetical protein
MLYFEQQGHFDLQFHVAKLYFLCSFKCRNMKIHLKHCEEVNSVLGSCENFVGRFGPVTLDILNNKLV